MKAPFFVLLLGVFAASPAFAQDIPARVTTLEEVAETLKKEFAAMKAEIAVLKSTANALAQQNEALKEQVVPVGSIQAYAGDKIPDGWLLCDGTEKEQSDYPKLFNAIGRAWGGSGTKFRLPDLQGRFLRGVAGTKSADPDKDNRISLYAGGNRGNQVGSYQGDATALPEKEFSGQTNTAGEHSHEVEGSFGKDDADSRNLPNFLLDDFTARGKSHRYPSNTSGNHSHSMTITTGGDSETRPTNAYAHFIIKFE